MKKVLLYCSIIIVLLAAGLMYWRLGHEVTNPFRPVDSGSPTVTTQNDGDKLVFKNYGLAPEFDKSTIWLNGEPQTPENLQGKVVVVNFWTYSCISCIHAIPSLNQLYESYKDQGLVIVGVHTPEYAFEKVTENVKNAITRYGIAYPIVQDNNYALWNEYNNQFWPTIYIIDREGKIVLTRFGDNNEELIKDAVQRLVGLTGGLAVSEGQELAVAKKSSLTIAFGLKHANVLASAEAPTGEEQVYTFPETLRRNAYALEGVWKLSEEKASLTQGFGRIRLSYNAAEVTLKAQSIKPVTLKLIVDGKPRADLAVQALKDYELFSAEEAGKHTLEIEIPQPGFEATLFIFE